MKLVRNQQGYALLIVLLMVVLFLGLSATFMAGSLSNAKQERTVDISNQAVASAEMGVKYHSADFQREIGIIKSAIIIETQNRIKDLVKCFDDGDLSCNTQEELDELQIKINEDMKKRYIDEIYIKVGSLIGKEKIPFPLEDSLFKVESAEILDLNVAGDDITNTPTSISLIDITLHPLYDPLYQDIRSLKVKLTLLGESESITKELNGIFTIEVPDTFLSPSESLTIETKPLDDLEMSYDNIFPEDKPGITCSELIAGYTPGSDFDEKECVLGSDLNAKDFVVKLVEKGLDPKDFIVFTENFNADVCGNNCNNISGIDGLTIVVTKEDADNFVLGNLNKFKNINFIVDGYITLDNVNSLGKGSEIQTMIFKEITAGNVKGGGISNTNLLILGKDDLNKDSRMEFTSNLSIGDNGRLCFDLDKILPSDVITLGQIAKFNIGNTTGQIIYYTSNLAENEFVLTDGAYQEDPDRTKPYVIGFNDYTTFLSSCGVDVSGVTSEITTIPTSYIEDPGFELEVEY